MNNSTISLEHLKFIKRALLSHLIAVSHLIKTSQNDIALTNIDLNDEYAQITNMLNETDKLINSKA